MSDENLYIPSSIPLDAPIVRVLVRARILYLCNTLPGCTQYHLVEGLDVTRLREAAQPIPKPDPIGAWYSEKQAEARTLYELLRLARILGAPEEFLKKLETRLEAAQYVGD